MFDLILTALVSRLDVVNWLPISDRFPIFTSVLTLKDHSFSTYAKFLGKLLLTPFLPISYFLHVCVSRGKKS